MAWQKAEKQENGTNNYVNISKAQLYLRIEIKDMGAQRDQPE